MPACGRKRAQKLEKTNSPPIKLKIVESERLSPETKTAPQEVAEPQKENTSEDSNRVDSSSCGFKKPETRALSQEDEKCEDTKREGSSPSSELKTPEPKALFQKPQTSSPPHKVEECGDSGEIGSPFCHFKKPETNVLSHKSQTTGPSHQGEECFNLRIDSPSLESKKPKTRMQSFRGGKCGGSRGDGSPSLDVKKLENSDDACKRDSCLREFEKLKQRYLELDNERAALTEAIGNETGLTAIMQKLHEYNFIKDITQLIIGSLSNVLNVPVAHLHQELNLSYEK
jgi:hypothetical protein